MKNRNLLGCILILAFLGTIYSCNDQAVDTEPVIVNERQQMLDAMAFTAKALTEISISPDVRRELLSYALPEFGGEVTAHFQRLLAEESNLGTPQTSATGTFSRLFHPRALTYNQENNGIRSETSGSISDLERYLQENRMMVYAPYFAENHANSSKPITVTYNPLDDSKVSNVGYRLVPKSSQGSSANLGGLDARFNLDDFEMEEVMVDDDYTYENPTLIVTPDDGDTNLGGGGGSSIPPSSVNPIGNSNFDCADLTDRQLLVLRMPECMLDGNYSSAPWDRNLFNLWVARGEITYVNGLPSPSADITKLWGEFQISRSDGRNGNWVSTGLSHFEREWTAEEVELFFAISRNRGSNITITGDVAFKNGGLNVDLDVSIGEVRNETLIAADNVTRCTYVATHTVPTSLGLRNGEAVQGYGRFRFYWKPEVVDY